VIFASDLFERTVANGWGAADDGGAYTVESTAANYSVGNGVGVFTVPATGKSRAARLDSINRQNVDIRFKVSANKVVSGGAMFVYAVGRRVGTSEYRPRLVLKADGGVAVGASVLINGAESTLGPQVNVGGLNQIAGNFIWLRAEIDGINPTRIRVKAWADGQPEPAGWYFTATNSQASLQAPGGLALRSYLSSGANAPVTLSFDNYQVASVMSSANVVSDEFIRNVASSWGTADTGGTYTMESGADQYAVNNGVGKMILNLAGKSRAARLDSINKRDVNMKFRVASDKVLSGANLFVYAFGRRVGTSEYRPRLILNGNGTISVGVSVVVNGTESTLGTSVVPGLTQSANSFIWVRAEITGTDPTTIRVKAWADGQSEPAGWNFTTTNSQASLQGPGSIGLRAYLGTGGSNAPVTLSFDDYTVTATQ